MSQQLPWGLVHQSRKRQGRTFIRIIIKSCVKWWMCGESSFLFQYCCDCSEKNFTLAQKSRSWSFHPWPCGTCLCLCEYCNVADDGKYPHFLVSCSFYDSVEAERGLFGKASPTSKESMCWYAIVVLFTSSIAGVPLHFVIQWWIWGFFPQKWKRKYLLGPVLNWSLIQFDIDRGYVV